MDITQLILDDHHEQRRLFALLEQIDRTNTAGLAFVWSRLATLLEVHAEAEERHFYPQLLKAGKGAGGRDSAEDETEDAIEDHNEIREAVAKVSKQKPGSSAWDGAVDAANKANSKHMGEEEREGLTDFRRHTSTDVRHRLGVAFITFVTKHNDGVEPVDKDPAEYIEAHK